MLEAQVELEVAGASPAPRTTPWCMQKERETERIGKTQAKRQIRLRQLQVQLTHAAQSSLDSHTAAQHASGVLAGAG